MILRATELATGRRGIETSPMADQTLDQAGANGLRVVSSGARLYLTAKAEAHPAPLPRSSSRPRNPPSVRQQLGTEFDLTAIGVDTKDLLSSDGIVALRQMNVTRIFVDPQRDESSGDVFGDNSPSTRRSESVRVRIHSDGRVVVASCTGSVGARPSGHQLRGERHGTCPTRMMLPTSRRAATRSPIHHAKTALRPLRRARAPGRPQIPKVASAMQRRWLRSTCNSQGQSRRRRGAA